MKDINQVAKQIADRYGIETYDKDKYPISLNHLITSQDDSRITDSHVQFYKSGIVHIIIATNFKYSNYWMDDNSLSFSYDDNIVKLLLPKMFVGLVDLDFTNYSSSFINCDNDELTLQLTPLSLLEFNN